MGCWGVGVLMVDISVGWSGKSDASVIGRPALWCMLEVEDVVAPCKKYLSHSRRRAPDELGVRVSA